MPSSQKWLSNPENQEKVKASRLKWKLNNPNYKKDPSKVKLYKSSDPLYRRKFQILKKYGITPEQYESLFLGYCPLCNINLELYHPDSVIDHNHITGEVRGVICRKCNMALGLFSDSKKTLINAIKYLGE